MHVVIAITNLLVRSRVQKAAREAGHEVTMTRHVPPPQEPAPDLLVVDLDEAGVLEDLQPWRDAHPQAPAVGFAFHANQEAFRAGRELGMRVFPHGASMNASKVFT
ncbi:MAG: hypothetical protein ACRDJF_04475 [Actinomycetota bacterium]